LRTCQLSKLWEKKRREGRKGWKEINEVIDVFAIEDIQIFFYLFLSFPLHVNEPKRIYLTDWRRNIWSLLSLLLCCTLKRKFCIRLQSKIVWLKRACLQIFNFLFWIFFFFCRSLGENALFTLLSMFSICYILIYFLK
jgi:hypothetical protein